MRLHMNQYTPSGCELGIVNEGAHIEALAVNQFQVSNNIWYMLRSRMLLRKLIINKL